MIRTSSIRGYAHRAGGANVATSSVIMSSSRPAPYVPDDLVAQAQSVLQGRSRNLIIRELQRTNLDVNLAVNNLLSRDEEDGDDADEGQDNYVPEDLISLLDAGINADHPSVIMDADAMFNADDSAMFNYSDQSRFRSSARRANACRLAVREQRAAAAAMANATAAAAGTSSAAAAAAAGTADAQVAAAQAAAAASAALGSGSSGVVAHAAAQAAAAERDRERVAQDRESIFRYASFNSSYTNILSSLIL